MQEDGGGALRRDGCLARDETLLCCFREVRRPAASAAARGLDELLGQDSVALG